TWIREPHLYNSKENGGSTPRTEPKAKDTSSLLSIHTLDPLLCPVATWKTYVRRLVGRNLKWPHPTLPDLSYDPLIRYVNEPDSPTGAERISNHIKSVMSLASMPSQTRIPKARAAGSTLAALK
ncbi:hypothetical protein BX616_008860, partial [Lobosporangium transversale]